ncbi:MAG: hypothetical protein Kow00108_24080 [Calditrichia bacterium]
MRWVTFVSLLVIGFFMMNLNDAVSQKKSVAKINFLIGKTQIIQKDAHQILEASFNSELYPGDRVETKKESRCEILYHNGNVVRLDENSIYRITRVEEEKKETESELSFGKLWANIVKIFSGPQSFDVKTPTAVAAVRGTVYQIKIDSVASDFKVFNGSIGVKPVGKDSASEDSTFVINEGEQMLLVSNFKEYMKQQDEAFKNFMKEQEEAFEKFMEEDQAAFEEFQKRDEEDFKKFNNLHYLMDKFDMEKEMKDDWVKWNIERDKALKRELKMKEEEEGMKKELR